MKITMNKKRKVSASWPADIPTYVESVKQELDSGEITFDEAVKELYDGGYLTHLNQKERAARLLGISASTHSAYKKCIMARAYNKTTGIIDIPELGIYVEGVKTIYGTNDINGNHIFKIVYDDGCWEYVDNGMTAQLENHGVDCDKFFNSMSGFRGSKPNSQNYKLTGKLSRLKNNKPVKASSSIKNKYTVKASQDRYNRTLKNPGPNKVNVQPYRGDYAVVVGLENGGYAYNTYLTEFTAKNEAETFRHYVQKFGADETANQWEFQKVEACDNSVTASTASHRYEVALDQGENEPLAVKFFDDYNKAVKWADSLHGRGGAVRITDNETGEVEELGDFQSYWNGKEDVTSCDNSVTASRIDVDNFDNTYEPDEFSQDPEGMGYEENKAVALVAEILDEYQSRTPTKLDQSIVDECYAYAHDYERSPSELADIVYSILDEAYPELVEACDCVNASVYTNPGTNKTPVESNVEYYQALADGVVALLDKNLNDGYVYKIRAEVTPEAITFLDDDNNIYWIQSGKDIIPNWDDLQDDIDELYGVVYMNAIPQF